MKLRVNLYTINPENNIHDVVFRTISQRTTALELAGKQRGTVEIHPVGQGENFWGIFHTTGALTARELQDAFSKIRRTRNTTIKTGDIYSF